MGGRPVRFKWAGRAQDAEHERRKVEAAEDINPPPFVIQEKSSGIQTTRRPAGGCPRHRNTPQKTFGSEIIAEGSRSTHR